jgi:hypothetical protein
MMKPLRQRKDWDLKKNDPMFSGSQGISTVTNSNDEPMQDVLDSLEAALHSPVPSPCQTELAHPSDPSTANPQVSKSEPVSSLSEAKERLLASLGVEGTAKPVDHSFVPPPFVVANHPKPAKGINPIKASSGAVNPRKRTRTDDSDSVVKTLTNGKIPYYKRHASAAKMSALRS